MPLDVDECATALFLKNGDIKAAAARLKITVPRLNKCIHKWPQLQRLIATLRATGDECPPATGS